MFNFISCATHVCNKYQRLNTTTSELSKELNNNHTITQFNVGNTIAKNLLINLCAFLLKSAFLFRSWSLLFQQKANKPKVPTFSHIKTVEFVLVRRCFVQFNKIIQV